MTWHDNADNGTAADNADSTVSSTFNGIVNAAFTDSANGAADAYTHSATDTTIDKIADFV